MTQQEAEVTLKVNSEEAKKKFDELEKKATQLRAKFADAYRKGDTQGLKEINDELNKVNREMDRMRTNAANIRAAMKSVDEATPRELQKTIKNIHAELNSGRVKRGSHEWQYYTEQLKVAHAELKKVQSEMKESEGILSGLNRKINDWGTSIATGMAAFAGLTMAGKSAVQKYADMETEEANVIKFTGMDEAEVARLNEEFKKMNTRTAREELNRLAQEAGRLGKKSIEDVLGFVRAADKINVALDELGDGATLELSKLTNIFGDEKRLGTEKALLSVGSVINELSQNCTAGAAYMVDYAQRMAGVGAQAKMTIPQIMSYAAVLDSQGQNVEASATAMSQLIMKMYQDPAKIAKAAGMDVKKFSEILKKDANEALITLLKTLGSYGGIEKLAAIFDDMGTDGARASAAIAALAGNIDMLVWEQEEANRAFREAISVTKEYDVQNNTVQARLDKAKKKFTEMAVTLGEKLHPAMQYSISGTSMLMRVMTVLIDFVTEHKKEIITAAAAIMAYNAIIEVHNAKIKLATAWTSLWASASRKSTGILSVFRLAVAAGTNAIQYFTNGLQINYAMQQRWRKAMVSMNLASWTGLIVTAATAVYMLATRSKEATTAQQRLQKIRESAMESASVEINRLKQLVNIAKSETDSLEDRKKAIEELNNIIPEYNAHLDSTSGKYIANKEKLDGYIESLIRLYEIEGAKEQLQDLGKQKSNLTVGLNKAKKNAAAARMTRDQGKGYTYTSSIGTVGNTAMDSAAFFEEQIKDFEKKLSEVSKREKEIIDSYGTDVLIQKKVEVETSIETDTPEIKGVLGESERERKTREKAEREEKKRRKEAETEAKKLLKEHLDSVKASRHQEEATNLAAYTSGQKNYLEYTDTKEEIDRRYIDESLKVLEQHGKKETSEYTKLLENREKLEQKASDRKRNASLFDVEQEHKKNEDTIVSDFFASDSTVYQNRIVLNQRLLEEDIRYLTARRDLYAEGSDEWIRLNAQIEERVAKDRSDKQQETAENINRFKSQYSNETAYIAMKEELRILDELHRQGLIKEKEYQEARSDIMSDFRDRNAGEMFKKFDETFSKAKSLFGDSLAETDSIISTYIGGLSKEESENFFKGFESGFDNFFGQTLIEGFSTVSSSIAAIKEVSEGNWKSMLGHIAEIAMNVANVIGGVMTQFSDYWNAERDIEISRIEKRYDAEIEAAGNNTKKVQKLEEQKEKEIAKTKTKYNNRAMKLEIAQAIAQTAANALGAYGAMVKIPVVGPALAAAAAALATAAGMVQVATIRKQHQAEAAGYYSGGFTRRDPNDRKEVGVVHANEFVANHQAVASPVLSPILNLIDHAQRTNTIGSITAEDVSNAIGTATGVGPGGGRQASSEARDKAIAESIASLSVVSAENREAIEKLSRLIEDGISSYVVLDGEKGLHRQYVRYQKLLNNPKR